MSVGPPPPERGARAPRRRFAVMGLSAAAILVSLVPIAPPALATWSQPGFLRSFGGRGEADVYAWGMAYNPVTDEMLVGDYWNFKIRRYNMQGQEVGAFFRAASARKGQPYSISVDARNGSIYVSEISDGKPAGYFAHYDKTGNYLGEFNSGARYTAWHTIDGRYLYVADSHYWDSSNNPPQIRKYDLDTNDAQVQHFGTYGTAPGTGQMKDIRGVAVDSGGRIYVADTTNRTVHVFSATGSWMYDFGTAGNGVGQFTGDLRGIAVNKATGEIYVVDAQASEIEKFQMSANPTTTSPTPVLHWGSEGQGPGQTADGGRAITLDASGNPWVADYGNFRFMKYTPGGALLATYPDPAGPPQPGGFSEARDVAVDPQGNVWGADSWNNRFQKFGPDGTPLGAWGRRNSHAPYGLDYPRGIGVDPVNGDVWVADTRDHILRTYDSSGNYLMTLGTGNDSTSTGSFRWPMDVEFIDQGGTEYAWVADYTSCLLKKVDATTGAEVRSISVCNNGLTVDVPGNRIYVVSWKFKRVYVYDLNGASIASWGSTGTGTCQFSNPWDIDLVNGVLYVTDAQNARVEAFTTAGVCLGQWGTVGVGPYQLRSPSGITHDAQGNIYVADAGNDRIQEFSFSVAVPSGGDTVAPSTATVTSPVAGQVMQPQPFTISGAAADDVGIASVNVAVKNITTGLWWSAKGCVWTTAKTWNLSGVISPTPRSVTYALGFVGVGYGQFYSAQPQVKDTSGNAKAGAAVKFSTAGASSSDSVAPTTSLVHPAANATVSPGVVTIDGQTTDNVAVAAVEVAIRDRNTGLWWNAETSSWGSLRWLAATVESEGALSSSWSYHWSGGVAGGLYYVQARSTDGSGNVGTAPYTSVQFARA
jgi:6-bladed beta-propeller/Bacterial Ig domain